MTLERAKPPGFTEDVHNIKARHLEKMDTNQAAALDGAAGGAVFPTTPIRIEGEGLGSDGLEETTIDGELIRHPYGRWKRKVDTTTIKNTASTQDLDMSSDVYILDFDHTGTNIALELQVTTGQTPEAGDIIEVVRDQIPSTAASFQVYSEYAPAVRIGVLPQAPVASNQDSEIHSLRYVFDGTTWQPLRFSADGGP